MKEKKQVVESAEAIQAIKTTEVSFNFDCEKFEKLVEKAVEESITIP